MMLVPSDNCLTPEPGLYDPTISWPSPGQLQNFVFDGPRSDLVVEVVVRPAFSPVVRIGLGKTSDQSWFLEVTQIGRSELRLNADSKGLPSDSARKDNADIAPLKKSRIAVDAEFARSMQELWIQVLGRTRYPFTPGTATGKFDGVEYHVWARSKNTGARAGYAHSPAAGSYLAELVGLIDSLIAKVTAGSSELHELSERMRQLERRAQQDEPCERSVPSEG